MRVSPKLLAVAAVIVLGIGYLMVSGFSTSSSYYMTVDELRKSEATVVGKPVRVMGKIIGESVVYNSAETLLTFQVAGEAGQPLTIQYHGIKPDNMNDQWEAIAEGRLMPDGTVKAAKVMIKCPSRYEGEQLPEGYKPPAKTS